MSRTLPTNGSGRGPGGSGLFTGLLLLLGHKVTTPKARRDATASAGSPKPIAEAVGEKGRYEGKESG